MGSGRAVGWYTGWIGLLTAVYLVVRVPIADAALWGVIALSGVVAMALGIVRNRPARRRPWLVLTAGTLLLGVGDTTSLVLRAVGAPRDIQPLALDAVYFVMFCAYVVGLLALSRSGVRERDRAGLLDAVTLTIGVGLFVWLFLAAPRLDAANDSAVDIVGAGAYPIGILLLVAFTVRLGWRRPSAALLSAGIYALAIGEFIYLTKLLDGRSSTASGVDVFWSLFYVAWGAAALHPSMARLGLRREGSEASNGPQRLALLSSCALVPSGLLIGMAVSHHVRDLIVVGVGGALMGAMVLVRLFLVLRQQRQALARERQVRRAGARMLAATTTGELEAVVRDTVAHLMPSVPHRAVLSVDDPPAPAAYPAVRRFPLVANESDRQALGTLLVAGPRQALQRVEGALEILAVQTALALTRARLTEQIAQRDAEVYFRTLVQHSSDLIVIIDERGTIRYSSPSAGQALGPRAAEGRQLIDVVCADERATAGQVLARLTGGEAVPDHFEWTVRGAAGAPVRVSASWQDLRDDPTVGGFVLTLRDVTEQRRLEAELRYRADHDPLTGLANRATFNEEADRAQLGDALAAVLFVDLDDFKEINDTRGHLAGDQVLQELAARLAAAVGEGDLPARLGGDEFAVLMRDAGDVSRVDDLARTVVRELSRPMALGRDRVDVSCSVGAATTLDSAPGCLMRDADRALYLAKQDGKRQWRRHRRARTGVRG
ncbi:sensor domain-containing diguanylate cyclase [Asanoa sp. WMMD1127]|uniref:sensor domain-containing diguanylate cyclase n=1 Tax=Asanoa sp. WMMD1127 TaxID=3016107 RepID=UPI002417C62C|nr:sensor domain-containing diguanylate cyclase [Asanoa sp. WMMD1127]MDG4825316.1 sensor domain-containing diguanylate cyclase [Asanoa sp. WMMD1127]